VHITALPSDYYNFDASHQRLLGERSGRSFQLGGRVRVQVARVDLDDKKIDLELIDSQPPRKAGGGKGGAGGGKQGGAGKPQPGGKGRARRAGGESGRPAGKSSPGKGGSGRKRAAQEPAPGATAGGGGDKPSGSGRRSRSKTGLRRQR
jgi:ribonuclease R